VRRWSEPPAGSWEVHEVERAGCLRPATPAVLGVVEVRAENARAVTVFLSLGDLADQPGLDMGRFVPGRFFMVWVPRVDEKPYAVSYLDGERAGITVQVRGPFSTRLAAARRGDRVGLRGPYGRGFWGVERWGRGERVALVGGGCGMAVLAPLAEALPEAQLVQGARTAEGLLFLERFPGQVVYTDDGSAGVGGFPTEWLAKAAAGGAVKMVYGCGPEAMLAAVAGVCREAGVPAQLSLERYMKCGIGVCGQCECDGRRVCVEGPTFDLDELAAMPSFGRRRRDKTGRATSLSPQDACPPGPGGGPG
jgi:dihydroorotate dehydrogenase electron transfer subunit